MRLTTGPRLLELDNRLCKASPVYTDNEWPTRMLREQLAGWRYGSGSMAVPQCCWQLFTNSFSGSLISSPLEKDPHWLQTTLS